MSAPSMPPFGKQASMFDDEDDRADSAVEDKDTKSSRDARKAQNRVAQREFRQRKQQYIRDLEARVEMLSGDKEERTELIMLLVRNLLKENKELRTMIKTMAAFVGEGLGSCLPRLGLSAPQLEAILNRSDTDTAYEAFVNLKASKELADANPGLPLAEIRRRGSQHKRKRMSPSDGREGTASGLHTPREGSPELRSIAQDQAQAPAPKQEPDVAPAPAISYPADNSYSYLFPNLDALGSQWQQEQQLAQSQQQQLQSYLQRQAPPPPGSLVDPFQGGYAQPASQLQSYGGAPLGGAFDTSFNMTARTQPSSFAQAYQQSLFGAQNPFSNFTGFGLTVPGIAMGPVEAPPAVPQVDPSSQAVTAPSLQMTSTRSDPIVPTIASAERPSASPGAASAGASARSTPVSPQQERTRQKHLREAVARITGGQKSTTEALGYDQAQMDKRMAVQREVMQNLRDEDGSMPAQAMQLITYHLNNFRVNHAYVLPASLRPTTVQRTVPHEHCIDGIPIPAVRDRMILLRGRYDLTDAFYGVLDQWRVHEAQPLDHRNWEISEQWLRDFNMLVDDEVVAVTNKWRQARGEPPLVRPA